MLNWLHAESFPLYYVAVFDGWDIAHYCYFLNLKVENVEEDRGDNRRRRSPLRNRSDFNESR